MKDQRLFKSSQSLTGYPQLMSSYDVALITFVSCAKTVRSRIHSTIPLGKSAQKLKILPGTPTSFSLFPVLSLHNNLEINHRNFYL